MARTDAASRVIPASADRVYAALSDPEALVEWLPPAGMHGTIDRFDLRPGGGYSMTLTYDDPEAGQGKAAPGSDVVEARFVEVVPARRIVQDVDFVSDDPAFSGTMRMTWALEPVADGTRVDLVAEHVPDGISPEDHATGMASSLAQLAAHVTRPS